MAKNASKRGLEKAPQGRLGLWSKADSQVLFDEFKLESLIAEAPPSSPPQAKFKPAQDP